MNSQDEMTPPRGETHHYGLSETPAQSTSSQAADTQTPTGTPFTQFNLNENTLKALTKMGFTHSTEIQTLVVPVLLEGDNDLVALASTGSGKTAAFGIPLMERVSSESKQTQGLILCPTRELAVQVSEQLEKLAIYSDLTIATIYGGASYTPQIRALKKGAQIIVATPGRLLDFIKQGLAKLEQVNTVVLDEADEMISMGFKEALDEILSHVTSESNKWLFSATMSREIKDIVQRFLPSPKQITINKKGGTSDTIEQVYYTVKSMNKIEAVSRILQTHPEFYGIVFCQTKAEVADLSDELNSRGFLVEAIHGDRSQTEREKVLAQFKKAQVKVLVATDVAARGLDIKDLTHVINFNLPWDVESYVHRIGRTGRNGKLGKAYSFVGPDQLNKLARIQRATGRNLIKGKIPTNAEVARISVEQLLERITKNTLSAEKVSLAKELIKDFIAAHAELKHDSPEALARLLVLMQPKIFQTKVDELDYMPGKVPRELQPFDQRDSRGGGEGRGGGGGRRDFRRDSRTSFRSTFGSRRDYGSSEGGRDGGGRDGNREGSRDGRRFSGERRDRKDQGPGRSSGQGFEGGGSFRRDRDDRPQFPRSKKGKGSSGRQFFRDE